LGFPNKLIIFKPIATIWEKYNFGPTYYNMGEHVELLKGPLHPTG
jgi:hypothetical protein